MCKGDKNEHKRIKKARRKNAKLYPIYKMLSWDLLFYNSIEFLFFTITKGITATEFLIISGAFVFFKVLTFVPAVAVSDIFEKRKSMIAANFFVALHLLILLFCEGMLSILVAMFICALGFSIKAITDSNLLYDSVATKGGDGLYEKIEAQGRNILLFVRWNCFANSWLFVCGQPMFTNLYLFRICYFSNHCFDIFQRNL